MQPDDIRTIQDFVQYCREVLATRPEYMTEKEQERPATAIVAACLADSFSKLEQKYPELTEIFDLASNLEISNSFNTSQDWRRIKQIVDKLEQSKSL